MSYVVYFLLPRDLNVFKEYESLGRVAQDVLVSNKTMVLFALLSA